jgi:hypothetical protein
MVIEMDPYMSSRIPADSLSPGEAGTVTGCRLHLQAICW